jgi:hypothetical protein
MGHWFHCCEYVVLTYLAQNAVGEVPGALVVRGVAVGAVLRVEGLPLGGDEELQEVGVVLGAVGAAIGDEDAAHPVVGVGDAGEGNASTLISMQCRFRLSFAHTLGFLPATLNFLCSITH